MSKRGVGPYVLDQRIGKGSFAQVWKGHIQGENTPVAIKMISRHTIQECTQLRQEVLVLKRIDHPNVVRFRDLKKSTGHFYLILEFCEGGDLAKFIERKRRVSEATARNFIGQMANGLYELHRRSYIHRDIKPQNILLTDAEGGPGVLLKIADFGFARNLPGLDMAATICGSPLYMAPEILRHQKYDARADLWSMCAILYELLYGSAPFRGHNPMQLLKNIEEAGAAGPSFPVRVPLACADTGLQEVSIGTDCRDLLRRGLVVEAPGRLSPEEFFSHTFIQVVASESVSLLPPVADTPQNADALKSQPRPSLPSVDEEKRLDMKADSSDDGERQRFSSDSVDMPTPMGALNTLAPTASYSHDSAAAIPELQPVTPRDTHVPAATAAAAKYRRQLSGREEAWSSDDEFVMVTEVSPPPNSSGGNISADLPSLAKTPPSNTSEPSSLPSDNAVAPRLSLGSSIGSPNNPPRSAAISISSGVVSSLQSGVFDPPPATLDEYPRSLVRLAHVCRFLAEKRGRSAAEALGLLSTAAGHIDRALASTADAVSTQYLRREFVSLVDQCAPLTRKVEVDGMPEAVYPDRILAHYVHELCRTASVKYATGEGMSGWQGALARFDTSLLILDSLLATVSNTEHSDLRAPDIEHLRTLRRRVLILLDAIKDLHNNPHPSLMRATID